MISFTPFEFSRDMFVTISAILLLIVAALGFFGITFPYLVEVVSVVLIIGGIAAFADAFSLDHKFTVIVYLVFSLLVIALGANTFYTIPYFNDLLSLLPVTVTNFILLIVIAVGMLFDAIYSDYI